MKHPEATTDNRLLVWSECFTQFMEIERGCCSAQSIHSSLREMFSLPLLVGTAQCIQKYCSQLNQNADTVCGLQFWGCTWCQRYSTASTTTCRLWTLPLLTPPRTTSCCSSGLSSLGSYFRYIRCFPFVLLASAARAIIIVASTAVITSVGCLSANILALDL